MWLWVTVWCSFYLPSTILSISGRSAAAAKSLQSCLILCDPIDGSLPGSPIPGILQARTLEWVAISFSVWQVWFSLTPSDFVFLGMSWFFTHFWRRVLPLTRFLVESFFYSFSIFNISVHHLLAFKFLLMILLRILYMMTCFLLLLLWFSLLIIYYNVACCKSFSNPSDLEFFKLLRCL